ncbi:MAG: DmsE family decaheme c-type cytochrome [Desulfuromonas sp.]|nr:DmsE family decaheme c-type cytochrome [Desulfuromonas sp.]
MERKSRISASRLVRIIPLLLLVGACATGVIREKILSLPQIEGATPVGQTACLECHEDAGKQMAKSVHGRLAEFELMGGTGGCEACHGPGSKHVAAGKNDQILKFGELLPEESAAVCAKCHSSGKLMEWTHGEHALADVGCGDCHAIHGGEKFALKKQEPELCYGCHQEQMAKASFPSHHPIKEGKMVCSDCHNPHGELQTEELARDLCLECHARYQGPFVFEHAPVEEDCSICHDPHGSVADNLLLQNEPFLCLQCHESHFHTTRIGSTTASSNLAFDGNQLQGTIPANGTTIAASGDGIPFTNSHGADGWKMAFGTKCTVCHSVVHGSDLPSQTTPTIGNNGQGFPDGGKGLTR